MNRARRKPVKPDTSKNTGTTTRETKRYATRGRASSLSQKRWFDEPQGDCHEGVFQHAAHIKHRQVRRRYELAVFQQMYCNALQNIFAGSSLFSATVSTALTAYSRLSANVVKANVDTATARIAKSKPRAFVLPNRGDYRLKKKAKNLTKFCDGVMQSSGFYAASEDTFRDACIYGSGAVGLFARDGALVAEPLKVDEVLIDQVDGMYDDPQEVHWEHPTPRTELLARYPKFAKEIEEARLWWRGDMAFMSDKDLVLVVRSWRKPSLRDGDDGRETVCICNATLEDKPYAKNYLPILRFHWTKPTYGPFGTGIAQELEGIQWTITNIMRDIAEAIHKYAVPRIFVDSLSGLSQHNITNEISVIKCDMSRAPPVFSTPQAMSPDVYQYVQWLIDQSFKEEGLSQLSAQSEKPAGLNSGVAMRTYQDVETQRFAIVGQRWERFYMQAARVFIDLAKDVYEDKKKLAVNVPGRGFIEKLDWKDVSLDADLYDIAVWPTNILPETPEGRLQTANDYVTSGFMPHDVAVQQLDLPILNDWIDQETAARDNIEWALSMILDKARYIEPNGVGNVTLAKQLAQATLLRAPSEDVEPHKIEMLQRFLDRATELEIAQQTPAAAPGAPPAPGAPAGQAPPPALAPLAPAGSGAVSMPTAAAA